MYKSIKSDFKVGDVVVCVEPIHDLILNKRYTISKIHDDYYFNLICLKGFPQDVGYSFYTYRFELSIAEIRKQKLNKICSK